MSETAFLSALQQAQASGRVVDFWLRDDDAVEPTDALDRLLSLTGHNGLPVTLAVIPETTGQLLAERLAREAHVTVAVHGWSHRNYAGAGEKKQELGVHRRPEDVLAELDAGRRKLSELHETAFLALLVPPWNRIAPALSEQLPSIGFEALSVFGPEKPAPLSLLNTHVDIMDWHGTRGGRNHDALFSQLAHAVAAENSIRAIGILTHHLVHDDTAWAFLERLFALTRHHPACRWLRAEEILASHQG